jgi:hypothetical protein
MAYNEGYMHMAAFYATQTASANLATLAAANDGILTLLGNGVVVPDNADLIGAYGAGAGGFLTAMQINNPDFRYVGLPSMPYLNGTLAVPAVPNFNLMNDQPLRISRVNTTLVQTSNSDAAGSIQTASLHLRFQKRAANPGVRYTLRATAAITGVTGSWVNGVLTFDTTLPAGVYEIQGMDAVGTNLLYARLVMQGASYRPGCVARASANNYPIHCFRNGKLGAWGSFASINTPTMDIFVSGACTAQTVWLDLVRTGDYN